MRQARTSRASGPAAALPAWRRPRSTTGTTWIVRPLLGDTARGAARFPARATASAGPDDPTNADQAFERPRIRAALDARRRRGRSRRRSRSPADAAAPTRSGLAEARRALDPRPCQPAGPRPDPPRPRLSRPSPTGKPPIYALRILLATAGGVAFAARRGAHRSLVRPARQGRSVRATLSRTVVDARRTGIFLRREARDLPQPCRAVDGMHLGRPPPDHIVTTVPGTSLIAPLGAEAAAKSPVTETAPRQASCARRSPPSRRCGGPANACGQLAAERRRIARSCRSLRLLRASCRPSIWRRRAAVAALDRRAATAAAPRLAAAQCRQGHRKLNRDVRFCLARARRSPYVRRQASSQRCVSVRGRQRDNR